VLSLFIRRLLWIIPTLAAVSFVTFLVLSYVPDPSDRGPRPLLVDREKEELHRRERFLDLPRFVNLSPRDARARTAAAIAQIARGGSEGRDGARELARLGGAALPHVLPTLGDLPADQRTAVAVALSPVAERMGLGRAEEAASPELAVAFWSRFWADRSVEFRPASVRTGVERLARYRTESRARELAVLDTFVVPAVMERLAPPWDEESVDVARTLVNVLAHVTDRDDRIAAGASVSDARACVARWRDFWLVYEADFTTLDGTSVVGAMVRETRYGKWAAGAALDLGGAGGESGRTYARIGKATPTTATLVFGGILIGYALGVLIRTLSAALENRRTLDVGIGALVVALHALPAAALALVAGSLGHRSLIVPTLVVAIGLVASPARHHRTALAAVLSKDYVTAARARGASRLRVVVRHGLRHAMFSIATLITVEPPVALGAAFVVESVFGLDGLGKLTVDAVASRDTSFLMGLALVAAMGASALVLLTDVLYGALDPRLRGKMLGRAA
jgi:ABC-type dipeptide/oligopeptide/nickel transport system permease component